MKNYSDVQAPMTARPPKQDPKKLNMTFQSKANYDCNLSKSPKISFVVQPFGRTDKQNDLSNIKSNVNIQEKSLNKGEKKRTASYLNASYVASQLKNPNAPDDRNRIKSRWERTQYINFSTTPECLSNRSDIEIHASPKTCRQNVVTYVGPTTNQQLPVFGQRKISPLVEDKFGRGQTARYKAPIEIGNMKEGNLRDSHKNIPLYQRIKNYNQPVPFLQTSMVNQSKLAMSNTFSYPESRQKNQQVSINKFMHSTISITKPKPYFLNLDQNSITDNQNLSKSARFTTSVATTRVPSFRQNVGKEPELEDFIVGQCKGEGRFGKVYMAIHKRTGMICALKKIKKDSVRHMIEQFIQELKIQLFLSHSKLVKMYGYFSDKENIYMLVQYMEEGCLYSLMKKNKKFEESEAAEKIHQICEGIKEMHDHNIVHRDLKPENVVMSNGVCKICDFGWAAICQGRRQTYCGTLDYVCPEIVEGNAYDSGVDIWCIGVLAYELMCGKAPFYDISRQKTIQKIKSCKIDNYPPHLSRKAVKFIEMILKKDPNHRVGIHELLDSQFLRSVKK